ncbi:hypothetical protein Tco_0188597 [Tanacetum coccineum]
MSATDSSSLTKPIQKSKVVLVDISENVAENDSIVAKHGLSSEITQSLGGSSDKSEGPKIVGASRIVKDQMKNTLKMKHSPRREAPRLHRYEDPPENPGLRWAKLVRILISEGSLSLLKILGTKSLAEMFTRERGYSQFNDVSSGYLVLKVS